MEEIKQVMGQDSTGQEGKGWVSSYLIEEVRTWTEKAIDELSPRPLEHLSTGQLSIAVSYLFWSLNSIFDKDSLVSHGWGLGGITLVTEWEGLTGIWEQSGDNSILLICLAWARCRARPLFLCLWWNHPERAYEERGCSGERWHGCCGLSSTRKTCASLI